VRQVAYRRGGEDDSVELTCKRGKGARREKILRISLELLQKSMLKKGETQTGKKKMTQDTHDVWKEKTS